MALRSAVSGGLVCLAPVTCWLLLELRTLPLPALAPALLAALLSVQAVGIALWLPSQAPAPPRERFADATLLALLPAPIGALLWLSGTVSLGALAQAQLGLLALAGVTSAVTVLLDATVARPLLWRAALQLTLVASLWQLRARWLAPLLA